MRRDAESDARSVGGGDAAILRRKLNALLRWRQCAAIISFGICGALSPALTVRATCVIASEIIGEGVRFATDKPGAGGCGVNCPMLYRRDRGNRVHPADAQAKSGLFARSGALAVDMERQIAAEFARQRNLPFVALRAVRFDARAVLPAGGACGGKPNGGTIDYFAVLGSLAKRPGQIGALIRTAARNAAGLRCTTPLPRSARMADLPARISAILFSTWR